MLNKSVLALVLSFSMLISPLPNGGGANITSSGGLSALGAGSSVIQTDETVTPEDAETGVDDIVAFADGETTGFTCDFEGESGNWDMQGDLVSSFSIGTDPQNENNKYLAFTKKEARTTVTTKALGENLPKMESASVAFKWYFGGLTTTSNSGFTGVKLMGGENEIVALYINEMRNAGNQATLFYSTGGLDGRKDSGKKVTNGEWYDFTLEFDFENHTVEICLGGESVKTVEIEPVINKVDAFSIVTFDPTGSIKVTPTMGFDNFAFSYEKPQAKTGSVTCDFENESGNWDMQGDLASSFSIGTDPQNENNKYLAFTKKEARTTVTTKALGESLPKMGSASVAFKWYFGGLTTTSNSGFAGVKLMSGENEIVALYINEMRNAGNQATLFYSTGGLDGRKDSGKKVTNGEWYDFTLEFDFENHTVEICLGGESVKTIEIEPVINKVDVFSIVTFDPTGSIKVTPTMGFDDFALTYTESLEEAAATIYKLADLPKIGLSKTEYASYTHPASVEATLLTGDKITVPVKADTWTSTPSFDGNTKGIYTWEAEIDPPAENENVNGLKATYQMYYKVPRTATEDDGVVVVNTDFGAESDVTWGMTGDLTSRISITGDSIWTGNKLLQFVASNDKVGSIAAKKSFADLPKMTTAKIEFEWYVDTLTSTSNYIYQGISFMSGENEIFSLYNNDMRSDSASADLHYSVAGFDKKKATGTKISPKNTYDVEIAFDFSAHTVTMKLNGTQIVSDSILEVARLVDSFSIVTVETNSGNQLTTKMTVDDFFFAYVEDTSISDDKVTIHSVDAIPNKTVTQEEWKAGTYKHPETVSVLLSNGDKIDVEIDADSWTCESFDENKKAVYTWTADLIAPEEYENTKNLKASYRMEYHVTGNTDHFYYNDFTFASEIWENVEWGKSMDSSSGTGKFNLSYDTDDAGNGYMYAGQTGTGDRGSRLDLSTKIVKEADVSFDWMPVISTDTDTDKGNGQLMFLSTDKWHPYFVLRFDKDYKITAYTENPLGACSTTQEPFEGSIGSGNAIDTGLSGQNKWFTVTLHFDYLAHTADLIVAERDNPSSSFTRKDIPIETAANGVRAMVVHMNKTKNGTTGPTVAMGLDNVTVDFTEFGAADIVSVKNPADVNVAQSQWDEFVFPETVEVTMGDGSKLEMPVGDWTSDPAHDLATSEAGQYVWTAPLVTGDLVNVYGLSASFTMTYTKLLFPTFVYNPNTLELPFGEALPAEFPKEVDAMMSDGTISRVTVGEWTPIREFNAGEEGIYVYGANVIPVEGKYDLVDGKLTPNENPGDPSAWRKDHQDYNVYYRVSYFKTNDNYNAYQRSMEYLDRGVYAIEKDGGVFVSWRLLVTEYGEDIAFNVYRNGELVNETPIKTKTNFVDAAGKAGDVYTVAKLQGGQMYESKEVTARAENYLSIPVQKPDPQPNKNGVLSAYTLNDAGAADVDGDGEYEIIVKWYPDNSFDSGQAGGPSSPTIFDVYKMDGTPLWRLNLGLELPSGAHFNQFMLYDLDEDGKAELFVKTSDGTVSYKPNAEGRFDMKDESTIVSYIGDKSVVPGTNVEANGHVNKGSHEFVTVFNGLTGEVIDSIDYVNTTGEFTDWGTAGGGKNDGGNRSARYNIAIAYLPKTAGGTETIPAVLLNRGYYAKTTVAAYTLRDGKLNLEWNFVRQTGENEAGKGNHNMSTGDIDKDGFDELIIGALGIDHDGSVLWVKDGKDGQEYSGHADTIHLAAMNPENNDLYVFVPSEEKETATLNHFLSNAATGALLNGAWFTMKDVGRAIAANITPRPGYEYWSAAGAGGITSGIYNFDGSLISTTKPVSMNWRMYWDGDLLSELGDGIDTDDDWAITKYDWVNNMVDTLATLEGTKTNNSTKKTPSLTADLFGDWREEVMLRNDDDTELRIYMTTEETDYMIYTLMHDPVYRNAVANQNTAYNQPPHIGFYLGADNADTVLAMGLPKANVKYTVEVDEEDPTPTPTPEPTAEPTAAPTAEPTVQPTAAPTAEPTVQPTAAPTAEPTVQPTAAPTAEPTAQPTAAPADNTDDDDDDEDDEPAATQEPAKAPAATTRPADTRPQTTARPVATSAPTAQPTAKPAATAAPTAKPETTAAPTAKPGNDGYTLTFDFGKADEIPAAELTDDVKKGTGCETVQQLISYMKSELAKQFNGTGKNEPVYTEANTVVVNVAVLVNGQPATKENFPKEGVDVMLPYPQGTNKTNFNFVVGHMASNDWNGAKPGVMEYLTPTKTDEGLKVHVLSASPFVISWTELSSPAQSDSVTTGGSFVIWIIVGVLAVALVGVGAVILVQQKKKKDEEQ